MTKRLLLKTGLVALLGVAAFVGYLWWTIPSSGINRASANRIRMGMTLEQAEAVIQLSAGDHRTEKFEHSRTATARFTRAVEDIFGVTGPLRIKEWVGDEGAIIVALDNDEVRACRWVPFSETFLDNVRDWLRLN